MRIFTTIGLIGAVTLSLATAAAAEVPAGLKPTAVQGAGLNVKDLEAQKAWYMDKLGMKLLSTFSDSNGKPHEYIVGYNGLAAVVALLYSPQRPAGPNLMGRVILLVPNAKGLAEHLKAQGVAAREVSPNVAYFINDPEGNVIELYTPPAPAAK